MRDDPVELDSRRGMAVQKATGIRRILAEVESNAKALRGRQQELEEHLLTTPALTWPEAAAKARYVLNLYAASLSSQVARHRDLVAIVLDDLTPLSADD